MTNINLKAGDIGETDTENDKAIEKLERQEANKQKRINAAKGKTSAKNGRQNRLALVEPVMLDKPDTLVSYTERPATNGEETKTTTTTASKEAKKARTATTATKKEVKVKTPAQPQYLTHDVNARGKTMMSPELVDRVIKLKSEGAKNPQIAEQLNISQGSVSTVLSAPAWFADRMVRYAHATNPSWKYPTRVEKSTEKKGN